MKVKLYMDVWQGWTGEHASALAAVYTNPSQGFKRLSFTVEVPDHLIQPKVDFAIQETAIAEEVK